VGERVTGRALRLTKHHGSGNDFLVLLSGFESGSGSVDPGFLSAGQVRALCDRHRGVGADGMIVGTPGIDDADLLMRLTNADGSPAEMSGNGIRCLVQAAVMAGVVKEGLVVVETAAGPRRVQFETTGTGLGFAEVEMGEARVIAELPIEMPPVSLAGARAVTRACAVDVGNPHVVLLRGELPPDLVLLGPEIERSVDGGTNVELVRVAPRNGHFPEMIELEVWERGVGITEACGTGACAAAAAAQSWGLVGSTVEVVSAGGTLLVKLGPTGVTLSGPTRSIAQVNVDPDLLAGLVSEEFSEMPGEVGAPQ
jgi:diaminopimelate epimerase